MHAQASSLIMPSCLKVAIFILKRGTNVIEHICFCVTSEDNLHITQNELYKWIKNYMKRLPAQIIDQEQMMQAMGLRSPVPIQKPIKTFARKDISWQEGAAQNYAVS